MRRQAPQLLALVAVLAACLACFVLMSHSTQSSVALLDVASPARLSALAEVQNVKGNGNKAVRQLLKGSLDSAEKFEEGKLYAHALQRAGLKLDPAAKQVIQMSLTKAGKKPTSLGIDPSLQKQVVVASSIKHNKAAHIKHVNHKHISDKLRLAEAILAGSKLTPEHAVHPKKVVQHTAKKTVRQSMTSELSSEDHAALANMERKSLQPSRSQTTKYLDSPEASSMMHELSGTEQVQLKHAQSHARPLTRQDLETNEWAHTADSDNAGGHSHSKLKNLPHKLDLTVGSGGDGTMLKVFDGPQNSRVALEHELQSELDGSAQSLGAKRLMRVQLASTEGVVRDPARKQATSLAREGRMQMEAQIRAGLERTNDAREERMFRHSLLKEGLDMKAKKKSIWG